MNEYYGMLYGAIVDSPMGAGETDYLKSKGYTDGNLHLEFKREDLLTRLNTTAEGNRLKNTHVRRAGEETTRKVASVESIWLASIGEPSHSSLSLLSEKYNSQSNYVDRRRG